MMRLFWMLKKCRSVGELANSFVCLFAYRELASMLSVKYSIWFWKVGAWFN
jgi:hypothetical protein